MHTHNIHVWYLDNHIPMSIAPRDNIAGVLIEPGLVLRALDQVLPHPDPLSVTTHYLRPGLPEHDCDIAVEVLRTGRTLSTVRATLTQDGKARLTVLT